MYRNPMFGIFLIGGKHEKNAQKCIGLGLYVLREDSSPTENSFSETPSLTTSKLVEGNF